MEISKINITAQSFEDICYILNNNYGPVNLKSFTKEEDFATFVATLIHASYKIGFRDGSQINTKDKKE